LRKEYIMGIIILVIVAALIAAAFYLIRKSAHKKKLPAKPAAVNASARPSESPLPEQRTLLSAISIDRIAEDHDWLKQRWQLAEEHRKTGDRSIFPDWFFHEMTKSQKEWLDKEGFQVTQPITKGQAADLIDLNHPASEQQLEILRFFQVQLPRDLSYTRAAHEIALLFRDPENHRVWLQRPASKLQKERARFLGIKLPEGVAESRAQKLISDHISVLEGKNDPRVDEWDSIENIIHQLSDEQALKEFFSIRKPGIELIIAALEQLKSEGRSYVLSEDNIESVVQKLLELKPDLELKS